MFSGGKRSFEEALKPEDDTEESPLKQVCLSKGDCEDLLINVTAPSFLMDTMSAPNETFHQVSDITLKTSRVVSPVKNQSIVELTVNRKSFFENIELKDTSMSFVQKRNTDDACGNSFSLRVDISTDHDSSKIVVHEDEKKHVNVEINEHAKRTLETSDNLTQQKFTKTAENKSVSSSHSKTVQKLPSPPESPMRFEPTNSKMKSRSKSVANSLYKKPLSGVGDEEYLKLRHSMALPKLPTLSQQKEMDIFR